MRNKALYEKCQSRRRPLAFVLLVVGLFAETTHAKTTWTSELDLEPSLRKAALVMAVRVDDVSQIRLVYGGKGSEMLYQYSFTPVDVLKGVYSRPQLLMTSADLRSYYNNFDPKDIKQGQQRLLLLGRSRVGYVNILPGQTADITFPRLSGRIDPLLRAVEVLLAQQEMSDRFEIVSDLANELLDAKDRGAVTLLAALNRRSFIAAQHLPAFQAANHQLLTGTPIVREAAAHVLGNLLESDYLTNQIVHRDAVAALVVSQQQTDLPLPVRLATLRALGSAVAAVRENEEAMHLVALDKPYDTFAELSARLSVIGQLHEDEGSAPGYALGRLLDELPLDAPDDLQRSAARSWARVAASDGSDRLLKRMGRKKTFGLDAVAEIEAFDLIFPKLSDSWPLKRSILQIGLNTAEQEAFVRACEHTPSPQLVPILADMLDPRHPRLRRLAADLLLRIDTKTAARALRPHLANETDLANKLQLATFLGRHGFDDGYPYAVEHMSDPRYVEAAMKAVAAIDKSGSVNQMLDIYRNSNDLGWKRAAVRALGLLGHKAFQEELTALTDDPAHPLAPSALQARADMGDEGVIELLPAALSSRSETVVLAATRAAATLLPQRPAEQIKNAITTALVTLAEDPESVQAVRMYSLEALVATDYSLLNDVLVAMVRDIRIEQTSLLPRVRVLLEEREVKMW